MSPCVSVGVAVYTCTVGLGVAVCEYGCGCVSVGVAVYTVGMGVAVCGCMLWVDV